jgi:aldehyde:ferredoxin oxidoreductase
MAKFLRIDMSDLSFKVEDVPAEYQKMGGRWLSSSLIAAEVPPLCHPLGPNNKVVFAPGIITGTSAPTSARVSVGGKSPLTGGIKESNSGASWAQDVANMRLRAIIVERQPKEKDKYWGALLTWDKEAGQPKIEFFDATEYRQKSLYEVFPQLYQRFGNNISVAGCGIAGENGYGNAGVVFNDLQKLPTRYSGRGGLGSVLGSKKLKFIITEKSGTPGIEVANKELFDQGRKKMVAALSTHAITKPKGALNSYGTAVLINIVNEAGGLSTRNFSTGRFEGAPKISGEYIFEGNKQRTGKETYNHACSPGCIIRCSNSWFKKDGKEHVSCVEYESDWALGANCGVDNFDHIAEMVRLCNDYGLDTIETGDSIAVAMDAGVIPFGAGEKAIELIKEMGHGTPLGRILGAGTEITGKVFGITRVPTVKGQSMPAYDPRAVKGIGTTYATTTMGADHTAGYTICPEILGVMGKLDPLSSEGKAALSRAFQATTAFIDSSGHCLFTAFATLDIADGYQGMIDECNGVVGTNWTADDILNIGKEILRRERHFNEQAGFNNARDRLPEFMKLEPLSPHNQIFDVSDNSLDTVFSEL